MVNFPLSEPDRERDGTGLVADIAGRRGGLPARPLPFSALPAAGGLYDPRFEHDACGVGFVAETAPGARRSARVVPLALEALAALTHRGAIAADARTGDGAGLAIPLVREVVARIAEDAGAAFIEAVGSSARPRELTIRRPTGIDDTV